MTAARLFRRPDKRRVDAATGQPLSPEEVRALMRPALPEAAVTS
jgi:hypothetical protein